MTNVDQLPSRLDVTQIFCDVDDFCKQWELLTQQQAALPSFDKLKHCSSVNVTLSKF